MPVFTKMQDGVLYMVVDGDYTSDELRRKGAAALEDPATPTPVPVLVDMSGAAGLRKKGVEAIRGTTDFFSARAEYVERVALLAPSDLAYGVMNQGAVFAEGRGLEARPFRTRAEALEWLQRSSGGEAPAP